uniref:Selenoprotein P N-terminal domain-containing protein n=1 Tax=Sander lucioperca TaxID=283035 RepID=A0A8C9WUP8_SANLU
MVVNQQTEQARRLHTMLAQRLSENITLYKQDEQQPDVWKTLSGQKDDFLIYDRCGRLTHHISLPYSIIGQGHVEGAIKDTYCKRICGDSDAQPDTDATPAVQEDTGHGHGHGHGHHHGHHYGVNHGVHPRGHDHNHGHHHGSHDGAGQQGVGQHNLDVGQTQMSQEAHQVPLRP